MKIQTQTTDTQFQVVSPYHPDFPGEARALGGKWDSWEKTWTFPIAAKAEVLELLSIYWGWTPAPEAGEPTVTVQVTLTWRNAEQRRVRFAGRMIAERQDRDWAVSLADNVKVVEGAFALGGGSKRNPTVIDEYEEVTVEITDVPLAALDGETMDYTVITDEDGYPVSDAELIELPSTPTVTVTTRLTARNAATEKAEFAGMVLAERPTFDGPVVVAENVETSPDGHPFTATGGTVEAPAVVDPADRRTRFVTVHDVPTAALTGEITPYEIVTSASVFASSADGQATILLRDAQDWDEEPSFPVSPAASYAAWVEGIMATLRAEGWEPIYMDRTQDLTDRWTVTIRANHSDHPVR